MIDHHNEDPLLADIRRFFVLALPVVIMLGLKLLVYACIYFAAA